MLDRDLEVVRPLVSLKHLVVDKLRAAITAGKLEPGSRLVERELCEKLGVSRTLLREALSQLQVEGLIEIIPHRGPVVATYTAAETMGIYETRATLEEMAGRLFVERASSREVEALELVLTKIRQSYLDPANLDKLSIKSEFYLVLAEGSRNPILTEMLRLLHSRVTTLRAATLAQPGRAEKALRELADIVRQIRKGDAAAAGAACRRHVENAMAVAKTVLSKPPEMDKSADASPSEIRPTKRRK